MNGPVNSRDWRDSVDRKWPYSRTSAQVRLVADMYAAAGVTIGVHLNRDEVDFVYEEGTLPVRDAYVDQVRIVVGGGDVIGEEERLAEGTDGTVEIPPYAGPVLGVGPVLGARPGPGLSLGSEPMVGTSRVR